AELLNKADSTIFQTERQLKEYGDKIPADKKQPIEDALAELRSDQYSRVPGTIHHTGTFIVPHYFFTKYKNRTIPDS
ncbi:hypothetical protein, partial [Klebsiella aerogenes]|uniref:hypothetical protein n=1 Tax=Klebsiella aerogenes TaxID=548 RepID=UPI001CC742EF